MPSVLVTGASGFIGRPLVRALRERGYDVVEVSRRSDGENSIALDLRDRGQVDSLPATDWVVHLAGGYAGATLADLRRDDQAIARNLLEWCGRTGVRNWVFASAAEVYGACPAAVSEDAPPRPLIPYGEIKLEVERLFEQATSHMADARVAVLRIGEVYGADGNLVDELTRRFESGFCPWFGSGNIPLSFVHVEDVAQACVRALTDAPPGFSVWNVADDEPTTWRSFLDEFARLVGARPAVGLPNPLPRLYAGASTAWDRMRRRQPIVTQHVVTLLTTPKVLSNHRLRHQLGVGLQYPNYRAGLSALFPKETACTE